jgi:ribulose-phosphate 3-epimerase
VNVRIAPSLLSADFANLAGEVADVQHAGADLLHLDIMDGHFVPNLTFGPPLVRHLARHCKIPMDAHLMVTDPDPLVGQLAHAGVARVAIHVEACHHLHRSLTEIRQRGLAAGVAINPATSIHALEDAIPFTDFILVMSVNPGFGGQDFIEESVGKIERIRALVGHDGMDITVDGGVEPSNARALVAAGANTLVAGSSIFGATDRHEAVAEIRRRALGAIPG